MLFLSSSVRARGNRYQGAPSVLPLAQRFSTQFRDTHQRDHEYAKEAAQLISTLVADWSQLLLRGYELCCRQKFVFRGADDQ